MHFHSISAGSQYGDTVLTGHIDHVADKMASQIIVTVTAPALEKKDKRHVAQYQHVPVVAKGSNEIKERSSLSWLRCNWDQGQNFVTCAMMWDVLEIQSQDMWPEELL